jgi:glutathione synthase/RimK-type ligase-like ATP-grasp enzyme
LAGKTVRAAVLVPASGFAEPWRWAYDVEAAALESGDFTVEPRPWTEPGDLNGFDCVLPLVAWGYHELYAEWLALLDRLEAERIPTINPVPLLRWNSDKIYLADLAAKGVPTVPTLAVDALDEHALAEARSRFGSTILVVKPPVSAAATGTHRLEPDQPIPAGELGQPMLIQPFLPTIASEGEYSIMLFGGVFSHAIVKRPKAGDFRVQPHLGGTEVPCAPPLGAIDLAHHALASAPAEAGDARVDMIADEEGALRIMELELIEPSLWLQHAPDDGAAFVSAVRAAIGR